MALIRDYDIQHTGVTITGAYHMITNLKIEKRLADVIQPGDSSRRSGTTANTNKPGDEINWKAGNVVSVTVSVFKDEDARRNGFQPMGEAYAHKFLADENESDLIAQAYTSLKSTEYYKDALEA